MFEEYEKVRIKKNGIIGTIIDKTVINGKTQYIVENDKKGEVEGAYGGVWAQFDCFDEDLERIKKTGRKK